MAKILMYQNFDLGPHFGAMVPQIYPKIQKNCLAMAWGVHSNGKTFLAQKLKEEFYFQCMGHYGPFWTISPKRGPKSKFCPNSFFGLVR